MKAREHMKVLDVTRLSVLVIAALLTVTALPYIYAHVSTPPELVYTGLMFDVPDHAQYWSWVAASRDSLFISNTMTPEVNPAIFTNPVMWILAKVQTGFGLSFPTLFQVWRVAAIVLLVPALVAFIRAMVPEHERRSTALLIALVGSGLGWTLVLAKKVLGTADVPWPTDLYTVEPNTFWSLLSYPHITLAHALILLTMVGAWRAYRGGGWGAWVLAAASAAALSVSHAYDLITIYVVLAAFGLVTWIQTRVFPVRLALVGTTVAACSGPVALYYQTLTSSDPLWREILSQYSNAGVWTPPHLHLVVLMGVPLLLAIGGALSRAADWPRERVFLVTWALVSVGLIYLPVVYQIKLLSGWQFPIAVLAAHGWHERYGVPLRRLSPALAAAVLAVLVGSTNLYLFAWRFIELRRHASPYYLHQDQVAALDWLARHADSTDVVLAQPELGQFVPNYGETRAYLAHWAMTRRFFERRDNVAAFFRPEVADAWRQQLLSTERVTLVVGTDWPGGGNTHDLRRSPDLELVFDRPRAQVYRFRPAGTADLTRVSGS